MKSRPPDVLEDGISVLEDGFRVLDGEIGVLEEAIRVLEGGFRVLDGEPSVLEERRHVLEGEIAVLEESADGLRPSGCVAGTQLAVAEEMYPRGGADRPGGRSLFFFLVGPDTRRRDGEKNLRAPRTIDGDPGIPSHVMRALRPEPPRGVR